MKMERNGCWRLSGGTAVLGLLAYGIWSVTLAASDSVTLVVTHGSGGGQVILHNQEALNAHQSTIFIEDGTYMAGKPVFLRVVDRDGPALLREARWSRDRSMVAIFHRYQGTPVETKGAYVAYDFKMHRFLQALPPELWRSRGGTGKTVGDGQGLHPSYWSLRRFEFPSGNLK
jgi:hypothetical protein